ncbi:MULTISPECIES: IclR family transcriptional regulator [unclassified Streptomyces]|uniref:IclR family transcriptional regulator n=1 Tax=unclassified Streptomyces TaxID=2593676 RepID=UPI002256395E|nr:MULTISPECIES: IclR family transcriptional regulator [unclassified Streptomyces]MCX5335625.1 IclR family transcriptional regulator [Streptomyces sp. NBC_00140]MCX5366343.1 IclR family transcriptional regulator [Streptomyces sp. NBC_00124]
MDAEQGQGGVRSVRRALDILSLLTEDQPTVPLRDMVEATGLPKTTVVRLVQTLEQYGLLWATPAGYSAGPGLWRWAHLAHTSWELPPDTQKLLRDLADRRGETANLMIRRDIHRVCVAQQESPQPLRHVVRVGDELPLWAGASSKVLLIGATDGLLQRVAAASPHGVAHVEQLRQWAEEATTRGYAVSHGERDVGLTAVAVPITTHSGVVVASLSLSGPSARIPDRVTKDFAHDLTQVAARIASQGFDHPLGPRG